MACDSSLSRVEATAANPNRLTSQGVVGQFEVKSLGQLSTPALDLSVAWAHG